MSKLLISRRTSLRVLAGMSLLPYAPYAAAQAAYPNRSIRFICPFAAGGSPDFFVRHFARYLSERIGQQVIVENVVGATGTMGVAAAARAEPDGYTIVLGTTYSNGTAQFLRNDLPYDIDKDFIAISPIGSVPFALVVPQKVPVNNVQEFIAHASKNPGAIRYASSGSGNLNNMAFEVLKARYKLDITHIPYRSGAQAILDTQTGRVEAMLMGLATASPRVKSGDLRALAITNNVRSPLMPDVPTMIEAGVPDFTAADWLGLMVPSKVPMNVRTKLASEAAAILAIPEFQRRLVEVGGVEATPMGPEEFDRYIKSETAKWRDIIKTAGIKAED